MHSTHAQPGAVGRAGIRACVATADAFYGAVAAFGLTLVSAFLIE